MQDIESGNTEVVRQKIPQVQLFHLINMELADGRNASFTVTGMSMWPFICHSRDQAIVTSCDPARLKVGDVILFQTPLGNYMLHRVTARNQKEKKFETTGDGNCFRDGWFSDSCIRAKVIAVIRKGETISCDSIRWRLPSAVWRILFPFRKIMLKSVLFIGRQRRRKKIIN